MTVREGWTQVPFGEVLADRSAGQPKTRVGDFQEAGRYPLVDQGQRLVGGFTNDSSALCSLPLPVILFGDHTRAVKFIDFPFGVGGEGVKILHPVGETDPRYLYWFLRSAMVPASGYDRHYKYLKRLTIPLPPLAEQRRIAAVLDVADKLRTAHRLWVTTWLSLVGATFVQMFGDPISNPRRLPTIALGDLGKIVTGNTPSRERSEYFGSDIEWIKSDNIDPPRPYLTHAREGLSEAGRRVGRVAPAGSVLITCIAGSRASIGSVALADRDVAFNQQINAVVPTGLEPSYLYGLLLLGKRAIQAASTDSMKGMVSKSRLASITLPVAPPARQRLFTERVRKICMSADTTSRAAMRSDELFASLQQRAFRGEL